MFLRIKIERVLSIIFYLFDQEITNNCFFNKTKFLIFKKGKIKEILILI